MERKERIKKIMSVLNLTVFAFEHIAHLSNATLSAPLKKGGNIGELSVYKICQAFSVNYDWIMKGEGPVFNTSLDSPFPKIFDIMYKEGITTAEVESLAMLQKGRFRTLLDAMDVPDNKKTASRILERLLVVYPYYRMCFGEYSMPTRKQEEQRPTDADLQQTTCELNTAFKETDFFTTDSVKYVVDACEKQGMPPTMHNLTLTVIDAMAFYCRKIEETYEKYREVLDLIPDDKTRSEVIQKLMTKEI